jgi:hypothetical protein
MSIYIDFRFVEIEYELWALQEYIRTLESQLPLLETQEQEKLRERIREQDYDESDANIEYQQYYDLIERMLPRFFRSPVLVTLWAIYESAIKEIASYIKEKQKCSLDIQDIRGDTLGRTKKYYDHVLKFPLITSDQTWEYLEMLLVLRNALAHGNGRKDAIKNDTWKKIEKWQKAKTGVVVEDDYLIFTASFVQEAFTIVSDALRDLIQRTRAHF